MSEEVIVLKTFNNEIDARMAQQMLQEAAWGPSYSKMTGEVWSLISSEQLAFGCS